MAQIFAGRVGTNQFQPVHGGNEQCPHHEQEQAADCQLSSLCHVQKYDAFIEPSLERLTYGQHRHPSIRFRVRTIKSQPRDPGEDTAADEGKPHDAADQTGAGLVVVEVAPLVDESDAGMPLNFPCITYPFFCLCQILDPEGRAGLPANVR